MVSLRLRAGDVKGYAAQWCMTGPLVLVVYYLDAVT